MNKPDGVKKDITNTKGEKYPFRRDFYYAVDKTIKENTFSFLLGPRKCGKTVCMKQLLRDYSRSGIKVKYVDFKTLNTNAQYDVLGDIYRSLESDEPKIYLLDEITHLENAELNICTIASETADLNIKNTKIIFTGSQSVTLRTWADRAFGGFAGYIYADFLSYPEYLKYKNIPDISEESYLDFLYNVADFYELPSLEKYLKGCLEETIVSNRNTANYVINSECDLLTNNENTLINICYQTLFSLHNQTSYETFMEGNRLVKDIPAYFKKVCKELSDNDIAERIQKSFIHNYTAIQSTNNEVLRQAIMFLRRCDLITVTPIATDLRNIPTVPEFFVRRLGRIIKNDLFNEYNITINYPMFYIRILQDVLREDMPSPKDLPRDLLGSIVECQARGLLPDGFEMRKEVKENGRYVTKEIDYVNLVNATAVEFTISPKHGNAFFMLPDNWDCECILLTKDKYDSESLIKKIPYYEYLYQLGGEEYAEKIRAIHQNNTYDTKKDRESDIEEEMDDFER